MSLDQDTIDAFAPQAEGMCFEGTRITEMTVPELWAVIVMQDLLARKHREQQLADLGRL